MYTERRQSFQTETEKNNKQSNKQTNNCREDYGRDMSPRLYGIFLECEILLALKKKLFPALCYMFSVQLETSKFSIIDTTYV